MDKEKKVKIIVFSVIGLLIIGVLFMFLNVGKANKKNEETETRIHSEQKSDFTLADMLKINENKPTKRGSRSTETDYYIKDTAKIDLYPTENYEYEEVDDDILVLQKELEKNKFKQDSVAVVYKKNMGKAVKNIRKKSEEKETVKVYEPIVEVNTEPISETEAEKLITVDKQTGKRTRKGRTKQTPNINLIKACIHGDQVIVNGQVVRMRLLEAIKVGNTEIPENTLFYGSARLTGERLNVEVSNIKFNDAVKGVYFLIYDNDGMLGLNLPNNLKEQASRQLQRGMLQGFQMPLSSIGTQAAEVTSWANMSVQVLKQAIGQSLSQVKVHLKANHKLFILEESAEQRQNRNRKEEENLQRMIDANKPQEQLTLEQLLQ